MSSSPVAPELQGKARDLQILTMPQSLSTVRWTTSPDVSGGRLKRGDSFGCDDLDTATRKVLAFSPW